MAFEPKTIHKVALSMAGLTVAVFAAGFFYTYYADQKNTVLPAKQTATTINSSPLPPPVKPAANAKEGASITTISTPIARGGNAYLTVQTDAGSACTVSVTYHNVKDASPSLSPTTADSYGGATWNWTIPKTAPIGSWPVSVTCTYNKQTAVVDGSILITSS